MALCKRRVLLGALALTAFSSLVAAQTDNFPNRPIKLVVNFPPGGNADLIGRVFARKLSEVLNTPVIVDNRGGAGGTIGADAVAKADNDGHTLLLTPYSVFTNKMPSIKTAYNALEDFSPVAPLTVAPLVLAASAESKVTSLADLAVYAKTHKLSYGTYGPLTTTHIGQHRMAQQLQAKDAVAVSYRGEAPMLADLLSGQIQIGVLSLATARENERAGKIRLLGLISPQRSEFLPHLPTLKELGFKGVDWTDGVVVFASSRTPAATMARLQAASRKVMVDEDTLKTLRAQPNQPWLDMTPQALKAQMAADTAFWERAQAEMGPSK